MVLDTAAQQARRPDLILVDEPYTRDAPLPVVQNWQARAVRPWQSEDWANTISTFARNSLVNLVQGVLAILMTYGLFRALDRWTSTEPEEPTQEQTMIEQVAQSDQRHQEVMRQLQEGQDLNRRAITAVDASVQALQILARSIVNQASRIEDIPDEVMRILSVSVSNGSQSHDSR